MSPPDYLFLIEKFCLTLVCLDFHDIKFRLFIRKKSLYNVPYIQLKIILV
jgi:hypothetical protein